MENANWGVLLIWTISNSTLQSHSLESNKQQCHTKFAHFCIVGRHPSTLSNSHSLEAISQGNITNPAACTEAQQETACFNMPFRLVYLMLNRQASESRSGYSDIYKRASLLCTDVLHLQCQYLQAPHAHKQIHLDVTLSSLTQKPMIYSPCYDLLILHSLLQSGSANGANPTLPWPTATLFSSHWKSAFTPACSRWHFFFHSNANTKTLQHLLYRSCWLRVDTASLASPPWEVPPWSSGSWTASWSVPLGDAQPTQKLYGSLQKTKQEH